MNNNIFYIQNKPEQQQLIVTQHYIYKSAKLLASFLLVISVLIPLIISILIAWIKNEIIFTLISFISIGLTILCEFIRNLISDRKMTAAKIQQKFDISVFELDNGFIFDDENIDIAVDKYKNKDWIRKKNWYPDYKKLEKCKAIFYCQKENIDWNNNLSKKYIVFLTVFSIILFIVIMMNFIISDNSISQIIAISITALPMITYCYSGFAKIRNDNKTLILIKNYSDKIETLILDNNTVDIKMLENLQWMIFFYRASKYLIPDWFDKIFYKKIENYELKKASKRRRQHR